MQQPLTADRAAMWTRCPATTCTQPATCSEAVVLESTDGPVEMVKTTCPAGHWFILPVSMLPDAG